MRERNFNNKNYSALNEVSYFSDKILSVLNEGMFDWLFGWDKNNFKKTIDKYDNKGTFSAIPIGTTMTNDLNDMLKHFTDLPKNDQVEIVKHIKDKIGNNRIAGDVDKFLSIHSPDYNNANFIMNKRDALNSAQNTMSSTANKFINPKPTYSKVVGTNYSEKDKPAIDAVNKTTDQVIDYRTPDVDVNHMNDNIGNGVSVINPDPSIMNNSNVTDDIESFDDRSGMKVPSWFGKNRYDPEVGSDKENLNAWSKYINEKNAQNNYQANKNAGYFDQLRQGNNDNLGGITWNPEKDHDAENLSAWNKVQNDRVFDNNRFIIKNRAFENQLRQGNNDNLGGITWNPEKDRETGNIRAWGNHLKNKIDNEYYQSNKNKGYFDQLEKGGADTPGYVHDKGRIIDGETPDTGGTLKVFDHEPDKEIGNSRADYSNLNKQSLTNFMKRTSLSRSKQAIIDTANQVKPRKVYNGDEIEDRYREDTAAFNRYRDQRLKELRLKNLKDKDMTETTDVINNTASKVKPPKPTTTSQQSSTQQQATSGNSGETTPSPQPQTKSSWTDMFDWNEFVKKCGEPKEVLNRVFKLQASAGEYASVATLAALGIGGAWYLWKKWKKNRNITNNDKAMANKIDNIIEERKKS